MKLLRELPEIEAKIDIGELTLTNLGLAQNHFISESAASTVSAEEKRDFLKTLENQSSREAKKIVLSHASEPEKFVERMRVILNELVAHRFAANNELQKKLKR